MKRRRMSKKASKKLFKRTARKIHPMNLRKGQPRGGRAL